MQKRVAENAWTLYSDGEAGQAYEELATYHPNSTCYNHFHPGKENGPCLPSHSFYGEAIFFK
ncbi:MAG: hypothetical protein LBC44_00785 [Mycoplasmataceae bacterium]|nr:hypothetical protein [Mycoplasmataceae bacterium]